MTPEQRAQLKIQREMQARTSQSIFDGRGELDIGKANNLSEGNLSMGMYLHMSMIPFAPDPDGSDHCVHLARLAEYIAQLPSGDGKDLGGIIGGPLSAQDQKILHMVSMLYCTGRTTPSDAKLVESGRQGYESKSAELAEQFFRMGGASGTDWDSQTNREEVCRLIYKHNDPDEIQHDKRLQAFSDARRYETARYSPNTAHGMQLLQARCGKDKYHCGWARDSANFRAYMLSRSWK